MTSLTPDGGWASSNFFRKMLRTRRGTRVPSFNVIAWVEATERACWKLPSQNGRYRENDVTWRHINVLFKLFFKNGRKDLLQQCAKFQIKILSGRKWACPTRAWHFSVEKDLFTTISNVSVVALSCRIVVYLTWRQTDLKIESNRNVHSSFERSGYSASQGVGSRVS